MHKCITLESYAFPESSLSCMNVPLLPSLFYMQRFLQSIHFLQGAQAFDFHIL